MRSWGAQRGHASDPPDLDKGRRERFLNERRCFNCEGLNHIAKDCPSPAGDIKATTQYSFSRHCPVQRKVKTSTTTHSTTTPPTPVPESAIATITPTTAVTIAATRVDGPKKSETIPSKVKNVAFSPATLAADQNRRDIGFSQQRRLEQQRQRPAVCLTAEQVERELQTVDVRKAAGDAGDLRHVLLRVWGKLASVESLCLLDNGSSHDFVSADFVSKNSIPVTRTSVDKVMLAGGASSATTSFVSSSALEVVIEGHVCARVFQVVNIGRYDFILGKPWFTDVAPVVDYTTNKVTIGNVSFVADEKGDAAEQRSSRAESAALEKVVTEAFVSSLLSSRQAEKCLRAGGAGGWILVSDLATTTHATAEVNATEVTVGGGLTAEQRSQVDNLIAKYDTVLGPLPQDLPPRRAVDHAIDLDDNARPASRGLIRLSPPEMMELQRQLEELLARGYIRPSTSQYGASVFFVKKNDAAGSLRLVCDYRALNSSTIKNHACMPHPETCFGQVKGARFFTKLDLAQGFHQIRLREGDEHKTAINTPFGHFEWTVLCFGLTNGPATLQTLMYDLLRPFLHKCAANMADDILIYSKTFSDHTAHVSAILDTLAAAQLYCKASKCEFFVSDVRFLGFRVSGETLQVDTSKLEGLAEHPSPVTVPEVRRFVGFCNFFRKFVPRYADIVRPLTALTHKFARFLWSTECQKAFDTLKDALLSAPVLLLPDPSSQFHLFTDASDVALGAVLQQADAIGQLHPVAFASRQLRDAETRYAALDRETLAFVFGLTMFKTYLFSKFVAHTDSSVLSHFKTKATLSHETSAGYS